MGPEIKNALIDTNVLIYYLNAELSSDAKEMVDKLLAGTAFISTITRIEILGWKGHSEHSLRKAENLLTFLNEVNLREEVIKACIDLRRTHNIRLPDAVIAATALHLECSLVTSNVNDFKKIDHLSLINPLEM